MGQSSGHNKARAVDNDKGMVSKPQEVESSNKNNS